MIKPATLWAVFKTCPNDAWIGRICRALGGQKVSLDFGQQQMVDIITTDSGWMDERVEAQRERWRIRDAKQREKQQPSDANPREKRENSVSSQSHDTSVPPSIPPSIPPSEGTDVPSNTEYANAHSDARACACACEGAEQVSASSLPTREAQLSAARNLGIPESFLDEFMRDMKEIGYQYVNRGGSLVTLNKRNFSALLAAFHRHRQKHPDGSPFHRDRAKHPDNWVDMDEQARKEFVDGMQ